MDRFSSFILEHENDDPSKLILSKDRWPDIDVPLAASTIEGRARMKGKVEPWWEIPSLVYPTSLCTQQCSSLSTAMVKASIVKELGIRSIADLTGGLGVDLWAFSKVAKAVLYNDADPSLCDAARRNFPILGMDVTIKNEMVVPGAISSIMDGMHPDAIFLDPARRGFSGKKVFLLEQCSPDITSLQDELLLQSPFFIAKLSPMADISMVASRLRGLFQVHVIGSGRECKELVCVSRRGYEGDFSIFVHEDEAMMEIPLHQNNEEVAFPGMKEGDVLFEPGKALSKAAATPGIPGSEGVSRVAPSTNLYIVTDPSKAAALSPFGRMMKIERILPYSGKNAKMLGMEYPDAAVSARNVPFTSERLREISSCSGNGPERIYAFTGASRQKMLLAAKPLSDQVS